MGLNKGIFLVRLECFKASDKRRKKRIVSHIIIMCYVVFPLPYADWLGLEGRK